MYLSCIDFCFYIISYFIANHPVEMNDTNTHLDP